MAKGLKVLSLLATGLLATHTAMAADSERAIDAGEPEVKKLLLLMDKDASGRVSKAEFLSYMEAEFARLDKSGDGELDVEELTHLRVHESGGPHK